MAVYLAVAVLAWIVWVCPDKLGKALARIASIFMVSFVWGLCASGAGCIAMLPHNIDPFPYLTFPFNYLQPLFVWPAWMYSPQTLGIWGMGFIAGFAAGLCHQTIVLWNTINDR